MRLSTNYINLLNRFTELFTSRNNDKILKKEKDKRIVSIENVSVAHMTDADIMMNCIEINLWRTRTYQLQISNVIVENHLQKVVVIMVRKSRSYASDTEVNIPVIFRKRLVKSIYQLDTHFVTKAIIKSDCNMKTEISDGILL